MRKTSGFSLVEVTLALGIAGFALIAIFGLLPVGTKSGADAIDATRISFIAQDAQNRLRATVTYSMFATSNDVAATWYYDRDGIFLGANSSANAIYRVDCTIHGTWGSAAPPSTLDESVLRPVTVQIRWPLNTSGTPLGKNSNSYAFYVRRP